MSFPRVRTLATALLLAAVASPALATTPHAPREQVPGVYHQRVGTLQVTA
ncbi:MAG: MBL fold metallo-hydrolase, partial [Stenotrophomonas maltophilia]